MDPPRDGNNYGSAYDRGKYNGHPLVGNKPETVHETYTRRHKEEAEVVHKET